MPNHVTTIFELEEISGNELKAAQACFLNDERYVDLDVLIPSPECLKDFEPHSGIISRAQMAIGLLVEPKQDAFELKDITDNLHFSNAMREATTPARPDDIPLIARAISNYADCGFMYWYDWNIENHGTKWGAYGQDKPWSEEATKFTFQSAWSHPIKVMKILSERIGGVEISVRYADEDTGSNCGKYTLLNGEIFDEDIAPAHSERSDEDRKKWMKFAFGITNPNDDPRSYGYDENWEYSDKVYEAYEAAKSA